MNEAQRVLRYFIPGSITVGLFSIWLVLDQRMCSCYPVPQTAEMYAALLAAGAAACVPTGFVAAQAASEVAWVFRRYLTRIDNRSILCKVGLPVPDDSQAGREEAAARVDLELQLRTSRENVEPVRARARSLIDLMQALGNGSAAAAIATGSILVTVSVTSHGDGMTLSVPRILLLSGGLGISLGLTCLMASSHRRVCRITEHYVIATLSELKRDTEERGSPAGGGFPGS